MAERLESRVLSDYAVTSLPDRAYYIPDFLTEEEEAKLLECIQTRPVRYWTELSKRRLQAWPSRLSNNKLVDKALPRWLSHPSIPRMLSMYRQSPKTESESPDGQAEQHIFGSSPHGGPNHVLINEYKPGQGIMPHEDGPAYFPVVATVSLGASIILDIYEKESKANSEARYRLLQEPRSLLITTDALYKHYLHGIEEVEADEGLGPGTVANWSLLGDSGVYAGGTYQRGTRISLTFRDVLHVIKPRRLFPGIQER